MTTDRRVPLRTPVLLTGARLLALTVPLWFAGCASLSSVHQVRVSLQAADVRIARAEARNRALTRKFQALHSELVAETKGLTDAQNKLAAVAKRASLEAREALQQAREANDNLMTRLADTGHGPRAGRLSRDRWLFAHIVKEAHALAQTRYAPPPPVPSALRRIDHRPFRSPGFQGSLPFWPARARLNLIFRPEGYPFDRPARIYVVTGRTIVPVRFTAQNFRLPAALAKQLPSQIPSSGFEIVDHGLKRHQTYAYLSFLGAGYFRARGRGQWWGALARPLAINTAIPNSREQFPVFRSFWIVPPARKSPLLTLFALLDGSSVTGAYRFQMKPGQTAQIKVSAVLFLRHPVKRLGLAPVISMFLRGRMKASRSGHLHPAVHDSDGLSFATATGQWAWAPLADPDRLTVRMFQLADPRGFGLMQRDRRFNAYQSLHRPYQKSPDVWIKPQGTWGAGQLELVEIPSEKATNRNIMAFWVPKWEPAPGVPFLLRYVIRWGHVHTPPEPLAQVTATREALSANGRPTFTLDFQSKRLANIPPWIKLEPSIAVRGPGKVRDVSLIKLAGTRRWQLRFNAPDHPGLILKAWIQYHTKPLSEVWTYQIPR